MLNRSEFGDAHDAFITKISPGDTPPPPANSVISGSIKTDGSVPMSDVTVTLIGYQTATTATDAEGNYSFGNLQDGVDYNVYVSKTNYDFYPSGLYVRNLAGHQTADFVGTLKTYDISGNITDDLSKALGGVIVTLTGSQNATTTTTSNGDYWFYVTAEGNYTVAPSKTAYRFNPQSLSYSNLSSHQWSANFKGTLIPGGLPLTR